jgi:homoserine dehydrogenase
MEKSHVGIVGLGTVGTGVAKLLLDHGDRTARHAGRTLWLEHVIVRDLNKIRQVDLPQGILSDNLERLLDDRRVSLVAQLIGGIEPARTIMLRLLESGKDVVTANKALLAEHGPELFDRARELGRSISFEAAVAGGIPIITCISQSFGANQINALRGILNGTSNYVISKMDCGEGDYDAALKQAQRLGFAEVDPTMDVDGTDAAQKLAILAHLAFGIRQHWSEIPRRGIDNVSLADVSYAQQLGFRIKLIAFAELTENGLQMFVSPSLVKIGTPLAEVRDNFNAVSIEGDAVGRVFFHGQGAGQMPTASAVVADMIDTAVGRAKITFQTLKLWSKATSSVQMAEPGTIRCRYYLRFNLQDQPCVLGTIATILGKHQISISDVIQHNSDQAHSAGVIPVVVMTHPTTERQSILAIDEIEKLDVVHPVTERLKVLD